MGQGKKTHKVLLLLDTSWILTQVLPITTKAICFKSLSAWITILSVPASYSAPGRSYLPFCCHNSLHGYYV